MKPARQTLRILRLNAKRAGHAEMADDRKPVIEMDGQIFRTAAKRLDAPAGKAFGKIFRKGKAQVGPICSTRTTVAPSMKGCRPRRTVSTSGSSGIGFLSVQKGEAHIGIFNTGENRATSVCHPLTQMPIQPINRPINSLFALFLKLLTIGRH